MSLIVPQEGEGAILALIVGKRRSEDLVLRLFVNDLMPNREHSFQDFVEPEGLGYEPKELTGEGWTVVEGDPSYAVYAKQKWEFGGELGGVFGYYLTQQASGGVVWAERFPDAPYLIRNDGDEIKVTPRLELLKAQQPVLPRGAKPSLLRR